MSLASAPITDILTSAYLEPLGEFASDPETIDWFTPAPPFEDIRGLTNLKPNIVEKPISILCFKECQMQPLFEEFFDEVILSTFVA